MLTLHPDTVVQVANQLHQERIAEARNAGRGGALRVPRMIAVRRPAGLALVRAGDWLLGPFSDRSLARS
jgi:hypothetical protein